MGQYKEASLFEAGISLGNPYNMTVSSEHIRGTVFDFLMAKVLSKGLLRVKDALKEVELERGFNIEEAMRAKKVYDFDHNITRHLYGYESVAAYYEHFGSSNKVGTIKKPLLGISSIDDDVCTMKAIP